MMLCAELRLATARFVLGLFSSEQVVQLADALLQRGMYSHALGELAIRPYPIWSEVGPLFATALKELSVSVPSWEDAAITVAHDYLADIAEGRAEPSQGLHRLLNEFYYPLHLEGQIGPFLAGACSLHHAIYLDVEYGHLAYLAEDESGAGEEVQSQFAALDREVVEWASRWLRERWSSRVAPAWLWWRDGAVVNIAGSIQRAGRFADLPVLADALEEAGCTDPDLLDHCRTAEQHVRACWAVDALIASSASRPAGCRPIPPP